MPRQATISTTVTLPDPVAATSDLTLTATRAGGVLTVRVVYAPPEGQGLTFPHVLPDAEVPAAIRQCIEDTFAAALPGLKAGHGFVP
jgi:hypothetical protein